MIARTTSSDSARGECFGRQLLVGIGTCPYRLANVHHFDTVPGDTPYLLTAHRTPCLLANWAQSLRTRSCFLSFVYMTLV